MRRLLAAVILLAGTVSAAAQQSSVSQAACRWGEALAGTEYMAELCPDLELTPLASDMMRVFDDHKQFKRCLASGLQRMAKTQPRTDDERRLYCWWLLSGDGNGQPVVQRR